MGVIYELLSLPERDKKKFLEGIIRQETADKLKPQKNLWLKNPSRQITHES